MEKVIRVIDNKISQIKNSNIDTNTVDFLSEFNCNILSLCEESFIDLVMLFYMVRQDLDLSIAIDDIQKIYTFLEHLGELSYDDVLMLTDNFYELKLKFDDELGNWTYDDFMSLNKDDSTLKDTQKFLKKYTKLLTKKEINGFLLWLRDDNLSDILCLSACLNGIKTELEKVDDSVDDLDIPNFFSSKDTRRLNNKYLKDVRSSYLKDVEKQLLNDLNELKAFKDKKNREYVGLRKNKNKQIKNLDELKGLCVNKTITVEKLLKLIDDPELINLCLKEIIKLNNEKYYKRYNELMILENNPVNILEKLFNDYNYNFNLLTEEEQNILMSLDNNDKLDENLRFLSTSSLNFLNANDSVFINILLLDIDSLSKLDSLLLRNKINNNFILKHGKKFNSVVIKQLMQNVSKLDRQKVDFDSLLDYNDKLLLDLDLKLLECISMYGIDFKNSVIKQYEFFENPELLNVIDGFIELGLSNQIKTLPNLINSNSKYIIKRIGVMEQVNIPYLNDNNTINQMARQGQDFYVSDDVLDEYNYRNYKMFMNVDMLNVLNNNVNNEILEEIPNEISFIEEYKKNEQLYIIGTKCFSRIKVLRILNTLINCGFTDYKEMLFNALIYNYPTYLSLECLEELNNLDLSTKIKKL